MVHRQVVGYMAAQGTRFVNDSTPTLLRKLDDGSVLVSGSGSGGGPWEQTIGALCSERGDRLRGTNGLVGIVAQVDFTNSKTGDKGSEAFDTVRGQCGVLGRQGSTLVVVRAGYHPFACIISIPLARRFS